MLTELLTPPPFPEGKPNFLELLTRKADVRPRWKASAEPAPGEADFRNGIDFTPEFPDGEGLLDTVNNSIAEYLSEANILKKGADCRIVTRLSQGFTREEYCLTVSCNGVIVESGDTEGIRRGLYALRDMFSAAPGPFLPIGSKKRTPWLENRISRCFFGPIKRPPFNIDELTNDIDYYPEEYLARLASEGVNGLWLTVHFREICSTSFLPENPDAGKRIEKLRRTVNKCRRYGIKIWVFAIEPACWHDANPCPAGHPELVGPPGYMGNTFCPKSPAAKQYLYECTNSLFTAVPHLGGLITISYGERPTSCLSAMSVSPDGDYQSPCQGCSFSPGDIAQQVLQPMVDGMHAANAEAQLISWLYIPQPTQTASWLYDFPEKLSKDVIVAYNFESGCSKLQLGKVRIGADYWQSCVGPGDRFGRMASSTQGRCELGAKLQVCSSHEVATIPFVPVPGLLYQKYKEMKKLGVKHVLQCWYFGNYPGLMHRAAGQLAFEDFSRSEEEFLAGLAGADWGPHAAEAAEAWSYFTRSYENYPLDNQFQYYGPLHDGPVWPLHLKEVFTRLPRTWKPDALPAGDSLGECLINHTAEENSLLLRRMAELWHKGWLCMKPAAGEYAEEYQERKLDLALYEALDIQFRSGVNIFDFYLLRRRLLADNGDWKEILDAMERIVRQEQANSLRLAELCRIDSRLGYHSEAEVYKYFPAKLEWRAAVLQRTLDEDFALCRQELQEGRSPKDVIGKKEDIHVPEVTYSNGPLSWSVTTGPHDVVFHLRCKLYEDSVPFEYLHLYFMDRDCLRFPHINILERGGNWYSQVAELQENSEEDGIWQAQVSVPRAMLGGDVFRFAVAWTRGQENRFSPFAKFHQVNYPDGNYDQEVRLNLSYFLPERLCKVSLVPKV